MNMRPFYAVATDDTHNYHEIKPYGCMPGRGWIMVRAKSLEAGEIVNAMNKGDFYASTGIILKKLDYNPAKGVLSIEVQPRKDIEYTIEFIGTSKESYIEPHIRYTKDDNDRPIIATGSYGDDIGKVLSSTKGTKAEYQMTGDELYVRAAVRSSVLVPDSPEKDNFQSAWTQPYGWEKMKLKKR